MPRKKALQRKKQLKAKQREQREQEYVEQKKEQERILPMAKLKKLSKQYAAMTVTDAKENHPFLHNPEAVAGVLENARHLAEENPFANTADALTCPKYPSDLAPPENIQCSKREWLATRQEALQQLSVAWELSHNAKLKLALTRFQTADPTAGKWTWEPFWKECEVPRRKRLCLVALAYTSRQAQVEFPTVFGDQQVFFSLCPELADSKGVDVLELANLEDSKADSVKRFQEHTVYVQKNLSCTLPLSRSLALSLFLSFFLSSFPLAFLLYVCKACLCYIYIYIYIYIML